VTITADTITDEQIRDLYRDGLINHAMYRAAQGESFLRGYPAPVVRASPEVCSAARARCVEILNAKAGAW